MTLPESKTGIHSEGNILARHTTKERIEKNGHSRNLQEKDDAGCCGCFAENRVLQRQTSRCVDKIGQAQHETETIGCKVKNWENSKNNLQ